jgi:hypothetical protein
VHSALQRYLRELDQVTRVVEGTPPDRWDAPTPCPPWRGRTSVSTRGGIEPTGEDDDSARVLPDTADLDRDGEPTCDWRAGNPW